MARLDYNPYINVWNLETKYSKMLAFLQNWSKNGYSLKERIWNLNSSSQSWKKIIIQH